MQPRKVRFFRTPSGAVVGLVPVYDRHGTVVGWNPFKAAWSGIKTVAKGVKKGADETAWFVSQPYRAKVVLPRWWKKFDGQWKAVMAIARSKGAQAVTEKQVLELVATREHIHYLVKHKRWDKATRDRERNTYWNQIRSAAAGAMPAPPPPPPEVIATMGEEDLQWISNAEPLFEGQSDGEEDPGEALTPITIPDPLIAGAYDDFMNRIGGLG